MSDMERDIFAEQTYGLIALEKLAPVHENFRLYSAGWMGDGTQFDMMAVKGAEFRKAKSGPNKGKLSIMVKGTSRIAYVTKEEMGSLTITPTGRA